MLLETFFISKENHLKEGMVFIKAEIGFEVRTNKSITV